MRALGAACLAAVLGAAGAPAQEAPGWLPPEAERGATEQLARRLAALEGEPEDSPRRLEQARAVIAGLRETLESWREEGVMQRAPEFPGLEVPQPGSRHLDAMARYHVCNLVLALQLQNPGLSGDADARVTAVLGLSGFTLAVVYLRDPFVAAGGTGDQIGTLLGGGPMEPLFARLQTDPEALRIAERQCEPAAVALLERPVERLGALAGAGE